MKRNQIEWEAINCDLCRSSVSEPHLDGVDWEFGRGDRISLVRCKVCSLIYLNPRPTLDSIPLIYPSEYGFYRANNTRSVNQLIRSLGRVIRQTSSRERYPYLDDLSPGVILDVGCATGNSLYPHGVNGSLADLKKRGWETHGCEIDERAVEIARSFGLNVRVGLLPGIDFGGRRFDVVRFNHVLEHSISPTTDLAAAASLLRSGGLLIVSGPNIASAAYSLFGRYWSGLDLPRHFYHFTPATLAQYCEKVGLRVEKEFHDSYPADLVHSLKHFLHSDTLNCANQRCSMHDGITEIFDLKSRQCLTRVASALSAHFDSRKLGDNYTVLARRL